MAKFEQVAGSFSRQLSRVTKTKASLSSTRVELEDRRAACKERAVAIEHEQVLAAEEEDFDLAERLQEELDQNHREVLNLDAKLRSNAREGEALEGEFEALHADELRSVEQIVGDLSGVSTSLLSQVASEAKQLERMAQDTETTRTRMSEDAESKRVDLDVCEVQLREEEAMLEKDMRGQTKHLEEALEASGEEVEVCETQVQEMEQRLAVKKEELARLKATYVGIEADIHQVEASFAARRDMVEVSRVHVQVLQEGQAGLELALQDFCDTTHQEMASKKEAFSKLASEKDFVASDLEALHRLSYLLRAGETARLLENETKLNAQLGVQKLLGK